MEFRPGDFVELQLKDGFDSFVTVVSEPGTCDKAQAAEYHHHFCPTCAGSWSPDWNVRLVN